MLILFLPYVFCVCLTDKLCINKILKNEPFSPNNSFIPNSNVNDRKLMLNCSF